MPSKEKVYVFSEAEMDVLYEKFLNGPMLNM
jgi:hypothetical protein